MHRFQEYLFSGVNEGDMADHTPPLESGQLLSPELPMLASPPPPAMVNGDGPQQCLPSFNKNYRNKMLLFLSGSYHYHPAARTNMRHCMVTMAEIYDEEE
ncbi:hypothetical protein NQZ68_013018 [Dissostichus eleginoides]|nr:hypothetical protein NQZ68_013018 [Dissostichus eleginoides]